MPEPRQLSTIEIEIAKIKKKLTTTADPLQRLALVERLDCISRERVHASVAEVRHRAREAPFRRRDNVDEPHELEDDAEQEPAGRDEQAPPKRLWRNKLMSGPGELDELDDLDDEPDDDPIYTVMIEEVMERSGLSRQTLYNYRRSGRCPTPRRIDKRLYWRRTEIERWLRERAQLKRRRHVP